MQYSVSPGDPGQPVTLWPAGSALERDSSGPTLVMAAHPRCACTRASLQELEAILDRAGSPVRTYVLLLAPAGEGTAWTRTDIRTQAAGIGHVMIHEDYDGREAARFGAATSGHVLLYSAAGELLFGGGITPQRGQSGSSEGRTRILSLLRTGSGDFAAAPVFGCALRDREGGS
jgi:hypothetical protein